MSKKLFKSMAGVVLSATMMISATATAFAVNCDCGSTNLSEVDRQTGDWYYVNPNDHARDHEVEYFCLDSWDFFWVIETEYASHSYDLNEETGMLVCDECGDSYAW